MKKNLIAVLIGACAILVVAGVFAADATNETAVASDKAVETQSNAPVAPPACHAPQGRGLGRGAGRGGCAGCPAAQAVQSTGAQTDVPATCHAPGAGRQLRHGQGANAVLQTCPACGCPAKSPEACANCPAVGKGHCPVAGQGKGLHRGQGAGAQVCPHGGAKACGNCVAAAQGAAQGCGKWQAAPRGFGKGAGQAAASQGAARGCWRSVSPQWGRRGAGAGNSADTGASSEAEKPAAGAGVSNVVPFRGCHWR